jgi:hypothetical protein
MSGEGPNQHRSSSPLTLPLWGLFLSSVVIAFQLLELNTNVKNQNDVIQQHQKKLHEVGVDIAGTTAEVRHVALAITAANQELTKELKLLRESQSKPREEPNRDKP